MTRTVDVQGLEADYPSVCVVCCGPTTDSYTIERTLRFGNRTTVLSVPVPMCPTHRVLAERRSTAETFVSRTGAVVGAVAAVASAWLLLAYWARSGSGNMPLDLSLAFVIAAGAFLVIWVGIRSWIAPLFAGAEGKAARHAVRIDRYWPARDVLRLQFANREFADLFERMNHQRLAGGPTEE